MPVITNRDDAGEIIDKTVKKGVSLAIFCTASHWNTEAILIAADNFAKRHGIENIPVAVAMTYTYEHMQQACRVTRSSDPVTGFLSIMEHIRLLCGNKNSKYSNVSVLPHLDHGDPVRDRWALTEGLPYLASVMFDAQKYPYEENMRITREYVEKYGNEVLIEGVMDELSVEGAAAGKKGGNYTERAVEYVKNTNVDFLVADLGTEQQSSSVGEAKYLRDRAQKLTEGLGKAMLVLHGTSCLSESDINGLSEDGIARVNMWTRIVREAGQYAAEKLVNRIGDIRSGNFEASESRQYIFDCTDHAAGFMESIMANLGYANLVRKN